MAVPIYEYTKTKIILFKWVNCMEYELCLYKTIKNLYSAITLIHVSMWLIFFLQFYCLLTSK